MQYDTINILGNPSQKGNKTKTIIFYIIQEKYLHQQENLAHKRVLANPRILAPKRGAFPKKMYLQKFPNSHTIEVIYLQWVIYL
jgi:hypothetical protein